ncbi:MAG: hypothetical protein R3E34_13945 [Rhodocyclaceae bacterium]
MNTLHRRIFSRIPSGWGTCAILLAVGAALDALISASLSTPV